MREENSFILYSLSKTSVTFHRKCEVLHQHAAVAQERSPTGEVQVSGPVPPNAGQDCDPQSPTSHGTSPQYCAVPHVPLSNLHPEPLNVALKQTLYHKKGQIYEINKFF